MQRHGILAAGDEPPSSTSGACLAAIVEERVVADVEAGFCEGSGKLLAASDIPPAPRPDLDELVVASIRKAFSGRLPLKGRGVADCTPLFVVGLPETGTRTVASLLSRHPAVGLAAGEGAFAHMLCQAIGSPTVDAGALCQIVGMSSEKIGRAYLEAARPRGGNGPMHFVDEQAINFLYVGLILQALPRARVLCVRRGAMDSVWNLFGHPLAPPFDYWGATLQRAARLVLLVQRLMGFWRQRFPGRIHEITYEWLVADPETETLRMLAHCGLDWHLACTLPAVEGDIGKWRDTPDQIEAITEFFAANGIPAD